MFSRNHTVMTSAPVATALLLLAACALAPGRTFAEEKKPVTPQVYYRFESPAEKGGSGNFEVLIRRFRHPVSGREVTLAGMVHVADAAFYTRIEKLADTQDIVLMEGVRPGESVFGILDAIPLIYTSQLGARLMASTRLEHQQDHLRTSGPNRRNADVTLDKVGAGDGITGIITLPLVVALGETGYIIEGVGEQLAFLTGTADAATRTVRSIIAESLNENKPDDMDEEFERVILRDRNTVVLEALDEELQKPESLRILIPWGAAHHVGLEAGLRARGFVPVHDAWVPAISVKDMGKTPETDPGFLRRLPYAISLRFSNTTDAVSGPLSLIDYKSAPRVFEHSTAWGLLHNRVITDEKSSFSLLAGILWTGEARRDDSAGGAYALLGLWGSSHEPTKDETRLGWWGFLGGVSTERDDTGAEKTSAWHLPFTFGKYPLIYGEKTDAVSGKSEHRFLLFFTTTSGK